MRSDLTTKMLVFYYILLYLIKCFLFKQQEKEEKLFTFFLLLDLILRTKKEVIGSFTMHFSLMILVFFWSVSIFFSKGENFSNLI